MCGEGGLGGRVVDGRCRMERFEWRRGQEAGEKGGWRRLLRVGKGEAVGRHSGFE